MIVGYHHFRKPPSVSSQDALMLEVEAVPSVAVDFVTDPWWVPATWGGTKKHGSERGGFF